MLARWYVGVCAVLALLGAARAVPHTAPSGSASGSASGGDPTMPPTWAADCGQPSHRPVALDTYSTTWVPRSWAQRNQITLQLHNYATPLAAIMSNDGDSVYLDFPYLDPANTPYIQWALNGTAIWTMSLVRLSLHWPSEHPIDGEKAYLELHMEHKDQDGLTWILAYNYDICDPPRSGFDVLSEYAGNISNPGSSVEIPVFEPQSLMPYGSFETMDLCDYFVYEFSESPSFQQCAPSVFWIVYRHPQCVSVDQLDVPLLDDKGGSIVHLDEPLPLKEGVPAAYITCF